MKKILFLLLLTVSSYGQTLQNPTYGNTTTNTLKIKTPATVTSISYLSTIEIDGSMAKIAPVSLPFLTKVSTATTNAQAYVKRADGTQAMFDIDEPSFEFIYGAPAYGGSFKAYAYDKNNLGSSQNSVPSSFAVNNSILASTTPDATAVVKGKVKLAGDLGGTADLPTTPTAIHKTGDETKLGTLGLNGLLFPQTSTSSLGTIKQNGNVVWSNYEAPGSDGKNLFLGIAGGNFTMSPSGGASYLASKNTSLGYANLTPTTTGWNNTSMGYLSSASMTTGYTNASFGAESLRDNTTGDGSTALGNFALNVQTVGRLNTAVGEGASRFKVDGEMVVSMGHGAGYYDVHGSRNVFVGEISGPDSFSNTVNNSIALGYFAINTASNQAVIGGDTVYNTYFGSVAALSNTFAGVGTFTSRASGGVSAGRFINNNGVGDQFYTDFSDGGSNTFGRFKRLQTGAYTNSLSLDTWSGYVVDLNKNGGSGGAFVVQNNGTDLLSVASSGNVKINNLSGASSAVIESDANGVLSRSSFTLRPYKVYSVLLSQTGTSAPTPIVLENNIGSIVWTRTGVGTYNGTLTGAFTLNKTFVIINASGTSTAGAAPVDIMGASVSSVNAVGVFKHTTALGVTSDNFSNVSLEIRVYP